MCLFSIKVNYCYLSSKTIEIYSELCFLFLLKVKWHFEYIYERQRPQRHIWRLWFCHRTSVDEFVYVRYFNVRRYTYMEQNQQNQILCKKFLDFAPTQH